MTRNRSLLYKARQTLDEEAVSGDSLVISANSRKHGAGNRVARLGVNLRFGKARPF